MTSLSIQAQATADFAAGKKNDDLYNDYERGKEYRKYWQLARLAAEDPKPPAPAPVAAPQEDKPRFQAPMVETPPSRPAPAPKQRAEGPNPARGVPKQAPTPSPEAPREAPKPESEQLSLLDVGPDWKETWKGMPDFEQRDETPWQTVPVHFRSREDRKRFADLVGQTITDDTRSIWFPKAEIRRYVDKLYDTGEAVDPKYPVYIISKGRWETRLTADALLRMRVPFHIVVEPQELEAYAAKIDRSKILVLPFSNLGQGSIPARNWVWEHAKATGAARHWILDDNIDGFYRLHDNLKVPCGSGATFRAAEDFADRYENVALAGMQYFMFASRKTVMPPFALNTRIYSCILIRNDLPHRWRGRYNEDTDLSIRILKDGFCTVLFNAFLAYKIQTMTMGGGNTDALYKIKEGEKDGRYLMAESLRDQHPEITKIVWKWGRWQHSVDYTPFESNKLVLRQGVEIPDEANNYGMKLRMVSDEERARATALPEAPAEAEGEP